MLSQRFKSQGEGNWSAEDMRGMNRRQEQESSVLKMARGNNGEQNETKRHRTQDCECFFFFFKLQNNKNTNIEITVSSRKILKMLSDINKYLSYSKMSR